MKMVQVDLKTDDSKMLTTWVENDPRVKEGVTIVLKEYPLISWKVIKKYSGVELDASHLDLNRGWTNNI